MALVIEQNYSVAKAGIPVRHSCRVLEFSCLGFYDWKNRPAAVVNAEEFALRTKVKQLFKESRESLGSHGLMRDLNDEESLRAGTT